MGLEEHTIYEEFTMRELSVDSNCIVDRGLINSEVRLLPESTTRRQGLGSEASQAKLKRAIEANKEAAGMVIDEAFSAIPASASPVLEILGLRSGLNS